MMRAKKGGAEPINRHTAAGIRIRDDRANKLRASARILSGSVSARRINASCCGGPAEAKNCGKRERESIWRYRRMVYVYKYYWIAGGDFWLRRDFFVL